jgi:hypothetical protein
VLLRRLTAALGRPLTRRLVLSVVLFKEIFPFLLGKTMPTIKQLPAATSVAAGDLLPLSQGGTTKALAVGSLLSSVQTAISVTPSSLLDCRWIGGGDGHRPHPTSSFSRIKAG